MDAKEIRTICKLQTEISLTRKQTKDLELRKQLRFSEKLLEIKKGTKLGKKFENELFET